MYTVKDLGEFDTIYIKEWERFKMTYEAFKSANQLNSTDKNQDKMVIY
jgi:hypothetical protein